MKKSESAKIDYNSLDEKSFTFLSQIKEENILKSSSIRFTDENSILNSKANDPSNSADLQKKIILDQSKFSETQISLKKS